MQIKCNESDEKKLQANMTSSFVILANLQQFC